MSDLVDDRVRRGTAGTAEDDQDYETFRVSGQHMQRWLTGLAILVAAAS